MKDFCTPHSKLSYDARAVIYEMWNHEHAEVWGIDGETGEMDELLEAQRKELCAGWDLHLKQHGPAGLRRDVTPVYDTERGQDAIAKYYAEC